MKKGVFKFRLFKKYRDEVEDKNYIGLVAWCLIFIGVLFLSMLIKLFVAPKEINWFIAFFGAILLTGLLLLRLYRHKVRGLVSFMCAVWYLTSYGAIFFSIYPGNDVVNLAPYAVLSISISVMILLEPIVLILGQLFGAILVCVGLTLSNPKGLALEHVLMIAVICLVAMSVGIASCYVRYANIVFERKILNTDTGMEDSFVDVNADPAWEGRNKYGILRGEITSRRRIFTFVVSVTKGKVIKAGAGNVLGIKEGMTWKEMREALLAKSLDSASRMRISKLVDIDRFLYETEHGKTRFSVIAGYDIGEKEVCWLDTEFLIRSHPLTGEVFATVVSEDVTEDRILMGIFNKVVEQNYDSITTIEKGRMRTARFAVVPPDEIRGTYGGEYNQISAAYIRDFVSERDAGRAAELMDIKKIEEALKEEPVFSFLLDEVTKEGTSRKKLFRYSYLDPAHNFLCVLKQDVTEVIENEDKAKKRLATALKERETAMNVRDEFMTRMSHEMRTPMNAILGLASLMTDEINNPKALLDYIKKVQYSGNFLLQLINDVLDMTKMEQKKFRIDKTAYSFSDFWEAVDMMIGPMCINKDVDFEWKSSIPGNYCVYTDPLRITQVFINLLSNAVKYTPAGGHVVFECREKERDENTTRLTFIVRDDGIGMSEEFQKHLFEPFAQESKDIDSSLNGTGLGLSIVKGIVDTMGGKISVKSEKGVGTTFKVVFDFETAPEAETKKESHVATDISGKRILVVEDNDINREIAVAILEKKDIFAETAKNGQEALEMFSSHIPGYYDMILMDIRMPVMSGLTATKRIRAMERDDAHDIPIIAMTANAFQKDVAASLDAGLNEHMSKPIVPEKLYAMIAKYCI